jgi:hypothetical protein
MRILVALLLLAALGGCYARPALVVEMNGRKLEFEKYQKGRIPKGSVEVTHMDSENIRVQGDGVIEVNGLSIRTHDDEVSIGGRKFSVDSDARVLVHGDGQIEVQLSPRQAAANAPVGK